MPRAVNDLTVAPPVSGRALDPYFEAVVDASEEAVLSSLLSATTTTGVGGRTIDALPTDRLRARFWNVTSTGTAVRLGWALAVQPNDTRTEELCVYPWCEPVRTLWDDAVGSEVSFVRQHVE